MEIVGLKNRPNFLEHSLTPAIQEGIVKMKYPNSPRHPRQKYLLTVKGLRCTMNVKAELSHAPINFIHNNVMCE